jgi:hypothetical protein
MTVNDLGTLTMINRINTYLATLLLSALSAFSHSEVTYLGSEGMEVQIFSICVRCHAGERPPQNLWLSTYADAVANASNANYRVQHGIMPPRNPLEQSKRDLFAAWVADGLLESHPPEIRNTSIKDIGEHKAQLVAEIFEHGIDSQVWFTYGPNTNHSEFSIAPEGGSPVGSGGGLTGAPIELSLAVLACNTEYFYQSHIANAHYGTFASITNSFWTQPCPYKNQAPQITPIPPQTLTAGAQFLYQVKVADPDDENNGKDLLFRITNAPSGMEISATGMLSWQPGLKQFDSGVVTVIVSDGGEDGASSAEQLFRVIVQQPDVRDEDVKKSGGGMVGFTMLLLLAGMLACHAVSFLKPNN